MAAKGGYLEHRRRRWGGRMAVAAMAVLYVLPALAQSGAVRFAIAPQPLGSALEAFAAQARLALRVDPAAVQGVASPGVSGALLPAEALQQLLAGTGLAARFGESGTVAIEPPAATTADGALQLGPVLVEEQPLQENALLSPGFVATHSSVATKTDTPVLECAAVGFRGDAGRADEPQRPDRPAGAVLHARALGSALWRRPEPQQPLLHHPRLPECLRRQLRRRPGEPGELSLRAVRHRTLRHLSRADPRRSTARPTQAAS